MSLLRLLLGRPLANREQAGRQIGALEGVPPAPPPPATEAVSLWLLLRAFASGCTAMTGVEAVSNGVSAFREPRVKHTHRTLTSIVVILAFLLGGIAYLTPPRGAAARGGGRRRGL